MRGASPNGAHPWLHAKPLDAASGKCLRRIAPAAAMIDNVEKKKNTNKTHLLPSFRMVDQQEKAKQFQDPSGTL